MKNIEIKISQETRMVDLKKTVIGNDAENLQGNLIFSFTDNFVNGTARLEYEIGSNKKYIMLEKKEETYITPIKSVLTKKGQINMQLVITEGTSENDIPIFKSNIFYVFCNQSINAEIEQPVEYPSWIEIANSKINEIDEAILGVEEAKRYAIEKGDYAKEQGDYAKSQGDYAKEQKIEVVKANEEANRIINNFETNVDEYTTAFNENANNKTNDFDSNAESKTSDFNQNVDNKISEYNNNASEKLSVYNTNAENKKSEFNTNVANQTKTFNDNATTKTNAFNSNANSKTETYNNNHTEKLNAYNTNATSKVNEYNTNAITKLQEYNTNADNKIAEYDLHSQELDNKIISTRNELERVKNDVLETGTDTDTFVHLEDSAMAEYQELSVEGVCKQVTTSGKNLLKSNLLPITKNGITISENDNGDIVVNGTITDISSGYVSFFIGDVFTIEEGTYTSSVQNKKVGIGLNTAGFDGALNITMADNVNFKTATATKTQTINPNINIRYDAGTFNNYIFNPMLEKSSSATSYEPFTNNEPSPSPDYPQPISTIENSLKITSCNKNLFDINSFENKTNDYRGSIYQRLVLKETADNSIKFAYNGGNYSLAYLQLDGIDGTKDYVFSWKVKDNTTSYTPDISKDENNSDSSKLVLIISGGNGKNVVGSTNTFVMYDIQVEEVKEGQTEPTPYEQHLETQINANLPEGEFIGKINDTYKDTLKVEYNEEDGQYHLNLYKNIGKVVLDGSENWAQNTYSNSNNFYTNDVSNVSLELHKIVVSSNYFKGHSAYDMFDYGNKVNYIANYNTTSQIRVFFDVNKINTVDKFKNWLSTHNTEVYYVLANPYVVDLGIVDQLITYNEITNLFTDSDLLPQINAKYYRNFISTVRNLQVNEKALKQELVDINSRLSALESASASVVSESEVIE